VNKREFDMEEKKDKVEDKTDSNERGNRREREVRERENKRRILGIMNRRHMMEMEERKGI